METIVDYANRGGIIVYVLIVLNMIGFSIIIWKFLVIYFVKKQNTNIIENIFKDIKNNQDDLKINTFRNILRKEMQKLEIGLNTIKIIANISPLIGLLGTVIGVLMSFDSISKNGLGDPSIFSSGISIALITTVSGMIVAIPHFIAYNYFAVSLDKFENAIESEVLSKL